MKAPQAYRSIPGWLSDAEAQGLYDAARKTNGGLLEVGTFLGRSTSALCEGVRDAGQVGRKFVSYDLSFRSKEEFQIHLQATRQKIEEPPIILDELWQRGTNSTDEARKNLEKHGLLTYVELKKGDFRADTDVYDTVFLDVMHNPEEITANLPGVYQLTRSMSLVLVHDMYNGSTLLELIRQSRGKLHYFRLIDKLAYFQRL